MAPTVAFGRCLEERILRRGGFPDFDDRTAISDVESCPGSEPGAGIRCLGDDLSARSTYGSARCGGYLAGFVSDWQVLGRRARSARQRRLKFLLHLAISVARQTFNRRRPSNNDTLIPALVALDPESLSLLASCSVAQNNISIATPGRHRAPLAITNHTMTANEFRKMALEFPGTVESAHMSHPDFRVEGRIFATLGYPDDSWGMVKLTAEQQRAFMKRGPGVFRPCNFDSHPTGGGLGNLTFNNFKRTARTGNLRRTHLWHKQVLVFEKLRA